MRIVRLTPAVEKKLLGARQEHDEKAQRIAAEIIRDIRRRGDAALLAWVKRLDGVDLQRESLWMGEDEIRAASKQVTREFLRALKQAARNVRRVAEKQLPRPWTMEVEPGVKIGQLVRPIDSIGCYIPGGRFALISTLVMTVVPAQVAGVRHIHVACPRSNAALLAAAGVLGVTRVARMGGAQAIAALAYGTKRVVRVEKIFGPGNRFVTAAKQLVSSDCAIDLPAGPTEAIVLAATGNPSWIAADLLAQAEHAPDAGSYLVTSSTGLAPSIRAACEFVNRFAPEHLSLPDNGEALLKQIHASGTVFLGPWGAQPLGDYASGSNHVLPTGGWARSRGGLSTADFVKCIAVQTIGRQGFNSLADTVETLAASEGLIAHRNAVRVRR